MFEKENVQVFLWNERLGDDCPDSIVKTLEGKPITLTVAGAKITLGFVRKVRRGRDGIFADLVIYIEEAVNYITDEDGMITEFAAVILNPETADIRYPPKSEELKELELANLKILNQFSIIDGKHYWMGNELETMKKMAGKYQEILELTDMDYEPDKLSELIKSLKECNNEWMEKPPEESTEPVGNSVEVIIDETANILKPEPKEKPKKRSSQKRSKTS